MSHHLRFQHVLVWCMHWSIDRHMHVSNLKHNPKSNQERTASRITDGVHLVKDDVYNTEMEMSSKETLILVFSECSIFNNKNRKRAVARAGPRNSCTAHMFEQHVFSAALIDNEFKRGWFRAGNHLCKNVSKAPIFIGRLAAVVCLQRHK